ncbi:MAG: peptidoglycan editing factor PgeF [Selenomonadaceae bacterium]
MSFYMEHAKKNIWYGRFSSFPQNLVTHAISTRFGGVSQAPFTSMNLALHNGDDERNVIENRKIFCDSLGIESNCLCTCEQVHGERILCVDETFSGRGSMAYADAIAGTDALITNVTNLPLMLFFADCTPILFFDPVHKAVGIAHGGWKGTIAKIAQKTVLLMQERFKTKPGDCLVAIGPAIGPCCYEVGNEVAEKFQQAFPQHKDKILLSVKGNIHLNLWLTNRLQLEDIGVKRDHIDSADVCTACNSKLFYSYRMEKGKTGRIAALISLKK